MARHSDGGTRLKGRGHAGGRGEATHPSSPREDHVEALIDEALKETFPASDPPAPAVNVATPAGKLPPGDAAFRYDEKRRKLNCAE
jgi:hypothetical protein